MYQQLPLKSTFTIICDNDPISLLFPQKTTIWSGIIFCIGCCLGICTYYVSVLCYCISFHHFMHLWRNLHPMLHCICVHVDVMVCVCQTYIKKLLTYLRKLVSLIGSRIWAFVWYQNRYPWMTFNGEMAHILRCSPNSVASGAHCVKVVEDKRTNSATEMLLKASSFSDISLTMIQYTWYRQFRIIGVSFEFPSVFYYLLVFVRGVGALQAAMLS